MLGSCVTRRVESCCSLLLTDLDVTVDVLDEWLVAGLLSILF